MRERWNLPTDPFRIAGNLYWVGTQGLGAFLFTTPEGHILIDGALPESVPEIEANIREAAFSTSAATAPAPLSASTLLAIWRNTPSR
jgi:hypothetical protein